MIKTERPKDDMRKLVDDKTEQEDVAHQSNFLIDLGDLAGRECQTKDMRIIKYI